MRLIDADELVKYLKKYHSMSQGVISDVEHFPTATVVRCHIADILEDVKYGMCNDHCKYHEECNEAIKEGRLFPCPLDKL